MPLQKLLLCLHIKQNRSRTFGFKGKQQSTWPSHWEAKNLPFLEFGAEPARVKGGRCLSKYPSNVKAGKCTYVHFCSPIRLLAKPSPPRNTFEFLPRRQCFGCPTAFRPSGDPKEQNLMVTGMTCVPGPRTEPSLLPQVRRAKKEIHVYIPSGKASTDPELLAESSL